MDRNRRDLAENQRIYRYWVEIRDLSDGSVRILPLHAMRVVHLVGKHAGSPKPDEQILRVQDDATIIEARNIDELAAHLRLRYPDEKHERLLHWERDQAAEQRKADALQALIQIIVEASVEELRRELASAEPETPARVRTQPADR